MRTHETTIGEGDAPVTCHYHFDLDGDLDEVQVMLYGVNIVSALTLQQLGEIEDKCRAAAKADYEDSKDDARIDAYIERTTA